MYTLDWLSLCLSNGVDEQVTVALSNDTSGVHLHVATSRSSPSEKDESIAANLKMLMKEIMKRHSNPSKPNLEFAIDIYHSRLMLAASNWAGFWARVEALQKALKAIGIGSVQKTVVEKGAALKGATQKGTSQKGTSQEGAAHKELGRLEKVIADWIAYRAKESKAFDDSSPKLDQIAKAKGLDVRGALRHSLIELCSVEDPQDGDRKRLDDSRVAAFDNIMNYCEALDRSTFFRSSVDSVDQDDPWRQSLPRDDRRRIEDVFLWIQHLFAYHAGMVTFLHHGMKFIENVLGRCDNIEEAVEARFTIHWISDSLFKQSPEEQWTKSSAEWLTDILIRLSEPRTNLQCTDHEKGELIKSCKNLWAVGDKVKKNVHPEVKLMLYIVQYQKNVEFNAIGMCQFCCLSCRRYIKYMQLQKKLRPFLIRGSSFELLLDWFLPFPCQATADQENRILKYFTGDATGNLFLAIKNYLREKGFRKPDVDMKLLAEVGLTREEFESFTLAK